MLRKSERSKTSRILFAIGLAFVFTALVYWMLSPRKIADGTFRLYNNMSACSDCPEYEIKEVTSGEPKAGDYVKKFVRVQFPSSMEDEIHEKTDRCVICFYFIVTGTLYEAKDGYFVIEADDVKLEESFEGCCD